MNVWCLTSLLNGDDFYSSSAFTWTWQEWQTSPISVKTWRIVETSFVLPWTSFSRSSKWWEETIIHSVLTKQPLRSPTRAWRRGVRVLSARGGENECQSMSEPGAERQHCTSNTVSTSEQISAYRLYFATERRLVLIGTCNWYNSQPTTRPGKLSDARRPSRVLSSRCDSALLLMLRGDLRSPVSKSFSCGDKRTAKSSKGFF